MRSSPKSKSVNQQETLLVAGAWGTAWTLWPLADQILSWQGSTSDEVILAFYLIAVCFYAVIGFASLTLKDQAKAPIWAIPLAFTSLVLLSAFLVLGGSVGFLSLLFYGPPTVLLFLISYDALY